VGFSIVSHSYIEQLCSIAVSHARTKDLVWLVYRHTAGKNKGQAGPTWTVTSGSLRASLQIARSTLQRCLSEAVDLGLITASREGYLWALNIDPNRPACGSTGPSAGHFEKQTGPPAGQPARLRVTLKNKPARLRVKTARLRVKSARLRVNLTRLRVNLTRLRVPFGALRRH